MKKKMSIGIAAVVILIVGFIGFLYVVPFGKWQHILLFTD
ncbi:hypothetical protein C809_01637 [Lachnospiraceae bacterium MD335]|nr:hypothetical protein C809_01637 [Lachnospiraceae bacterium MD335]